MDALVDAVSVELRVPREKRVAALDETPASLSESLASGDAALAYPDVVVLIRRRTARGPDADVGLQVDALGHSVRAGFGIHAEACPVVGVVDISECRPVS